MKITEQFKVNMQVNKHNIDVMIEELKSLAKEKSFNNTRINKTLYSLYLMRKNLNRLANDKHMTQCSLKGVKKNANYDDLLERYIHANCMDPCSTAYKREIRHLLLAGTNIAELDITATVVYIFAHFITKDPAMQFAYKNGDFYSILGEANDRDEQKKATQIWLQGPYAPNMTYNRLFPMTSEYLKQTAVRENDLYKRNSGLFRDQEVKLLNAMLESDLHIVNHLHDGYYLNNRLKKKCGELIKQIWGDNVKYKVHDFSKDHQSDDEIKAILRKIKWDEDPEDVVDLTNIPCFMIKHDPKILRFDPYGSLYGILLDDTGRCIYDDDHNPVKVSKSYVIRKLCMNICE